MLAPGTTVHSEASAWVLVPDQPSADSCRGQVSGAVRESLSASDSYSGSLVNCGMANAHSMRTT